MKTPWEIEQEQLRQGFVRIVFEVEPDESGYPSAGTRERLWALPAADGYRLDGIPWFARLVACDDVVAVAEKGGELLFASVVRASGHSTIRVIMSDKGDTQPLRDDLAAMECPSESMRIGFFAVDIPPTVAYWPIQEFLERRRLAGALEYEESCISEAHSKGA